MTGTREAEDDRKRSGRRPEGPAHAREGSALQTLKRTFTEFSEDNLTDSAAALTYYAVLSIFPALIAMISIVGLVGDPQTVTSSLTKIIGQIGPAARALAAVLGVACPGHRLASSRATTRFAEKPCLSRSS